jgi:hypothetical protein
MVHEKIAHKILKEDFFWSGVVGEATENPHIGIANNTMEKINYLFTICSN